ncbi:hypothetical protein [Bdellovibrio sp.]|uniref:hypothetical protein n=1 Tax=Bdellovibrio sp. TaxID=28201 RepID=UPI0039E2C3CA
MLRKGLLISSFICSTGLAQQSTTTLPQTVAVQTPEQAVASSSISASETQSPWKLSLGSENYTYEIEQRTLGAQAPVVSSNWIGAVYNVNPKWAIELRQHFQYATNKEKLTGRDKVLNTNDLAVAETLLRIAAKPEWSLWGSKPIIFELRYYIPVDRVAQQNRELGRLRADYYAEWMMNPKWSLATWLSPRIQLNSADNPNKAVGADAEYYQIKFAPYLSYYFNDNVSAYYACALNQKYSQAQRGNWTPDMANVGAHEIGMYIGTGPFLFNPALISETNLDTSDGSVFSKSSRVFSYETLSYNLNAYATF